MDYFLNYLVGCFAKSDAEAGGEREQARAHKEAAAASNPGADERRERECWERLRIESGLAVSPASFLHTPRGASALGDAVS